MSRETTNAGDKGSEWRAFLIIAVFLFPVLAATFVGAYGFIIWILQMIFGPPGHGI
ncbi:periplasmic nitrate reductase NapE [Ferrimonas balearica DSM 9799]|uniref:Periplasmic nitrate reductase NapE n=1 Tax=Ferrimonas balearica (strain DSM 9799 / CCM 4581 / KCTC 23876 / PAT) TaxID=550540 RepID=E1SVR8_FERBD|nr:periplasmic nitrate reductase, NapE protein [Ferrimonas balearica]ADN76399.1 periplasmic nitrate reductase NapE [Ferrimonas balearica DSM 9799]MBY6093148.1 periplasmic nitrate reductase, NapE protein [Ferrimonas balearica]